MPKIRALKPEFWTDEAVVSVQPLARLLFQGLWNYACDNGHVEDKPRQLKMRILPADNCDVVDLLNELAEANLITRKDGWIIVPNLPAHQRPDKRYFLFCELPGCGDGFTAENAASAARFGNHRRWHEGRGLVEPGCEFCPIEPTDDADSPTDPSGTHRGPDVHTMGTHRGPIVPRRGPIADGDGDGDGDGDENTLVDSAHNDQFALVQEVTSATASDRFEEFWKAFPRRSPHSNPKAPAKRRYAEVAKKTDPQILINAAHAYAKVRRGQDPSYTVQTIKWLRDERWNDELTPNRMAAVHQRPEPPFVPLLKLHGRQPG